MSSDLVLVDEPAPRVRRVTLNRPEKRNALNHDLRGGIIRALEEADAMLYMHDVCTRLHVGEKRFRRHRTGPASPPGNGSRPAKHLGVR